jgi:hypothetical protein
MNPYANFHIYVFIKQLHIHIYSSVVEAETDMHLSGWQYAGGEW